MRPQLYCDIDSTINDHWKRIQRNSKDGVIHPSAWTEEEVMQDMPLPGAVEALNRFAQDWDVNYLSARDWPDAMRITEQWLRKHGFPINSIHLVPSLGHKVEFLKQHWCDLYIDDFSGGQELVSPIFYDRVVEEMPCPYEIFRAPYWDCWDQIVAKYFGPIPNGERFWQMQRRNLEWWRVNREFERTSRDRYYQNFCRATGLNKTHLDGRRVAEVGAGPFGGLINHTKPRSLSTAYIDIFANAQRVLRFIDWGHAWFVDSPVERIPLPDKSIDVLVSYNAIDHGSNVFAGLDEIFRVSKECYIAFDCKGDGAPPHDRLDHYQVVHYETVCAYVRQAHEDGKVLIGDCGDLRALSPGFHFEHNWGFPMFYLHAKTV